MDEIFIEEKKYISSKRAAKVTGYAKDYVGQLCREGRLPARLVGRSWYVLEAAIHDHRFGNQKIEQETQIVPPTPIVPPMWESPRYEASPPAEAIPSINRLQRVETTKPEGESGEFEVSQRLQDSWKAWFDRIADDTGPTTLVTPEPEKKLNEPSTELEAGKEELEIGEIEEEINVPIHTLYRRDSEEVVQTQQKEGNGIRVVQIAGIAFAVLTAILAVLGTGYLDEYIVSNSQIGMFAGIILHEN